MQSEKNSEEKTEEKDGNYVRSIVAMINESPVVKPLRVSPSKDNTPPRSAPSYLSVSRSNNGYNNALLYGIEHRRDKKRIDAKDSVDVPYVNGNGTVDPKKAASIEIESPQYVSLSQMLGPKTKVHSKYSDLGLQLKSPEKNCRSFLRNINSFEMIGRQSTAMKSPEGCMATMVGQKMQHMLHLDASPIKKASENGKTKAAASTVVAPIVTSVPDKSVDVPDRAVFTEKQPNATDKKSSGPSEAFANEVLNLIGEEEADESFDPPPTDLAGQHFRKIASENKERLLSIASFADKVLKNDTSIPEDIQGLLRSASGKANLIVRERFKQFDQLCEDNLCPKPGKLIPGPSDLAGFWDMVMIEVNSIFNSFRDLANAAKNEWIMVPKITPPRTVTMPYSTKLTPKKVPNPRRVTSVSDTNSKKNYRARRKINT